MADYFPPRDGDMLIWLKNFSDKLPGHQKDLGLTDAQVKSMQGSCDQLSSAITANQKKQAEYQAQIAATNAVRESALPGLRAGIRLIKAQPGFAQKPAIGPDLGIVTATSQLTTAQHQVTGSAEVQRGRVRIQFRKGPFDSVNVYARRPGQVEWTFLARDTHTPYDDCTPLAQPGVPESREYRLIGVCKDQEQGLPSDILHVTCSG